MTVSSRRPLSEVAGLFGWVVLCLTAGGLGAFATASSVRDWYPTIAKPDWNPPAWVFGPVWTTLYVLMGVAAWLIWRRVGEPGTRRALAVFLVQLLLNTAWSFLFFGLRSPLLAAIEIVFLASAIAVTLVLFSRISKAAGGLLIPYLGWVAFATVLNITIAVLNR